MKLLTYQWETYHLGLFHFVVYALCAVCSYLSLVIFLPPIPQDPAVLASCGILAWSTYCIWMVGHLEDHPQTLSWGASCNRTRTGSPATFRVMYIDWNIQQYLHRFDLLGEGLWFPDQKPIYHEIDCTCDKTDYLSPFTSKYLCIISFSLLGMVSNYAAFLTHTIPIKCQKNEMKALLLTVNMRKLYMRYEQALIFFHKAMSLSFCLEDSTVTVFTMFFQHFFVHYVHQGVENYPSYIPKNIVLSTLSPNSLLCSSSEVKFSPLLWEWRTFQERWRSVGY